MSSRAQALPGAVQPADACANPATIGLGGIDFTSMFIVLSGDVPPGSSLEAARESGAAIFAYGAFLTAVINFLVIAWVVFLLVKAVNRIKDAAVDEGEPVPAAPKGPTQEELLSDIRDLLKSRGV